MFKKNVGKVDAIVRTVIGVAILGVGLYYRSWWGLLGLLPLGTGLMGSCLLYRLLKIDTSQCCESKPSVTPPPAVTPPAAPEQ